MGRMRVNMKHTRAFLCLLFVLAPAANPQSSPLDVKITSSKDGAQQPALFYVPATGNESKVPLLIFLHSWSTDYKSAGGRDEVLDEGRRRGWVVIIPNFRGMNDHPDACGSDLAVQDVIDSVKYAKEKARVDEKRVYLLGSSGGGHMALLMAARAPQLWTAVSAWVPITKKLLIKPFLLNCMAQLKLKVQKSLKKKMNEFSNVSKH